MLLYPDDLADAAASTAAAAAAAAGGAAHDEEDDSDQNTGGSLPLSLAALMEYEGDTVVHVGEWFGDTFTMSMEGQELPEDPYPWGRSTDPRFQTALAASFHKVLQVPLPNWGSVRNCLTVWKRTECAVISGDRYAYVPEDERLSLVMACKSTEHLLK